MRILAAIAVIAASITLSAIAHRAPDSAEAAATYSARPKQDQTPAKPPGASGNDMCRHANDNECDEPGIGTGLCAALTDRSDCAALRAGVDNDSCIHARDRRCDEPVFGTGACAQGTDVSDCGNLANFRNRDDSCTTAFNGVCEEPSAGNGACAARTDRTDCFGRARPLTINDHFFGNDDRVHVPTAQAPWRFMGRLEMDTGGHCTATLISPYAIATAAHCITSDGGVDARATFVSASGEYRARVIAYLIDPAFNHARFSQTNQIAGLDWALLRLDQPLGIRLGFARPRRITGAPLPQDMMQAGYGWDTGPTLTGHVSCRMLEMRLNGTFSHACDTTRGDSGSGFVVRNGAGFDLVGVDSAFHPNLAGPDSYVAVSAGAFAELAPDFIAGRTGTEVRRARPTKAD